METQDKARRGDYTTKLPYPDRVKMPSILKKTGSDLTLPQIRSVPSIRSQYNKDVQAYEAAKEAYHHDVARLNGQFRDDLEHEYGVTNNPKAALLWSKAWERGHSSGHAEVAMVYEDLYELIS